MRCRGFTLVEMLVVMTIGAILVAAAVPAFQWTITRNRISDATNLLLSNLEYARMEASRRGSTISICRAVDPNADEATLIATGGCSSVASATVDGNDWATGWLVFEKVLPNADEARFENLDRVIFRQQVSDGQRVRVMMHSNITGAERIAFQPRQAGGVVGWGTFAITYGQAPTPPVTNRAFGAIPLTNAGRCIPVTLVGSVRVAQPGTGPCPAA